MSMFWPVDWKDPCDNTTIKVTADNICVSTEKHIDYAGLSAITAPERKIDMPEFDVKDFVVHEMNSQLRPCKIYYANPSIEKYIHDIYADTEKGVIVVKWADKTITKVKVDSADDWDLEAGVNAAIVKRLYKSHNAFKKFIKANTTYIQRKKKEKK